MHTPHFASADENLSDTSLWEEFDHSFAKAQALEAEKETQLCVEQVCADRISSIGHLLLPMVLQTIGDGETAKAKAAFAFCLAMVSLPHRYLNLHPFAMVLHSVANLLRLRSDWLFQDALFTAFSNCIVTQIGAPTPHVHSTLLHFKKALTSIFGQAPLTHKLVSSDSTIQCNARLAEVITFCLEANRKHQGKMVWG